MQLVNKNKKKKKKKGRGKKRKEKGKGGRRARGSRAAREFKREKNAKSDLYRSFGQYLFHRFKTWRGLKKKPLKPRGERRCTRILINFIRIKPRLYLVLSVDEDLGFDQKFGIPASRC